MQPTCKNIRLQKTHDDVTGHCHHPKTCSHVTRKEETRFGDRAQQLVFIGQNMDEAAMRAGLDACLLDESLAAADSKAWAQRPNPFPELQLPEEDAE